MGLYFRAEHFRAEQYGGGVVCLPLSAIVIRNPESAMPQGVERLWVPFFLAKSAFDF